MKAFYKDNHCIIYQGNCLDILHQLPKVDLVLTDPPYGHETHTGARHTIDDNFINFDSVTPSDVRNVFQEIDLSGWLVATMEWRHILPLEQQPPENLRFVRFGIWDKPTYTPQFTGDRPAMGWEAIGIFHSRGGRMKWNGGGKRAVFRHNKPAKPYHPTEKPISLLEELIDLFSNAGDRVLDPFMGSGTTLLAAKQLNRKAIGIEIEEKYCEIAARRLSQQVLDL